MALVEARASEHMCVEKKKKTQLHTINVGTACDFFFLFFMI